MPKIGVEHSTSPGNHEKQSFFEIRAGLRRCAHTVPVRADPAKIHAGPFCTIPKSVPVQTVAGPEKHE